MNILLDIKIYIATFDPYVWLKLYTYDEEFKMYACGDGINVFIRTFSKMNEKLPIVDVYHSIDDQPYKFFSGAKKWFSMGKLHRNNDLPAVIYSYDEHRWYKMDLLHRENDLPAIVYKNLYYAWYLNNKKHRDNDPAVINNRSGINEWYCNGFLIKTENK